MFKSILLIIWIGAIFILTCAASFNEVIQLQSITFNWQHSPDLSAFFAHFPMITERFMFQKVGHICSFFFLTILLFACYRSFFKAFTGSISYAFLTEILQLYFSRDGRLFDVGFDAIGIFAALYVAAIAVKMSKLASNEHVLHEDRF